MKLSTLLLCLCSYALAQTPPAILQIDIENFVEYQNDLSDQSKLATSPNITPVVPPRNFYPAATLGDIVAVNGELPRAPTPREPGYSG
jgi:hypothetical protein